MHGGAWVGGLRAAPPPAHGRPNWAAFCPRRELGPTSRAANLRRTQNKGFGSRRAGEAWDAAGDKAQHRHTGRRPQTSKCRSKEMSPAGANARSPLGVDAVPVPLGRAGAREAAVSGATGSRRERQSRLTRRHQLGPTGLGSYRVRRQCRLAHGSICGTSSRCARRQCRRSFVDLFGELVPCRER